MQLKTAFAHADRDGGGDLSVDEFVRAFLGILGKDMGEEGLRQMFMKIDANADGTVDWDEFSSFMLLQNQGKQNMHHNEAHAEYSDKPFDIVSLSQSGPLAPFARLARELGKTFQWRVRWGSPY